MNQTWSDIMRIVFVGCRNIAFECLRELLANRSREIVSVYTLSESQAPQTAGFRPFDELMNNIDTPCYKVEDINSPEVVERIKEDRPDLIIQVGWSQIIKDEILNIPKLGCVGFHSSLLPKYSGGSPVNWGIINGETEWGITFFYLEPGVDSGDIIAQKKFEITLEDTCKTVYDKATQGAVEILREYLDKIKDGTAPRIRQDKSKATKCKRRKPEDGLIDWNKSAMELYNWIRALTHPYPGAFTYHRGGKLYIWKAGLSNTNTSNIRPGKVVGATEDGFVVATRTKGLIIKEVQIESESEMTGQYLFEKYRLREGDNLGQ